MHGKDLVIDFRTQNLTIRHSQLGTDKQRLYAANQEKEKCSDDVHETDLFMISRHEPFANISLVKTLTAHYAWTLNDGTGCHEQFLHISSPVRLQGAKTTVDFAGKLSVHKSYHR